MCRMQWHFLWWFLCVVSTVKSNHTSGYNNDWIADGGKWTITIKLWLTAPSPLHPPSFKLSQQVSTVSLLDSQLLYLSPGSDLLRTDNSNGPEDRHAGTTSHEQQLWKPGSSIHHESKLIMSLSEEAARTWIERLHLFSVVFQMGKHCPDSSLASWLPVHCIDFILRVYRCSVLQVNKGRRLWRISSKAC